MLECLSYHLSPRGSIKELSVVLDGRGKLLDHVDPLLLGLQIRANDLLDVLDRFARGCVHKLG